MSNLPTCREVTLFPEVTIRSLVWHGDTLVDWVSGGQVYCLDGSSQWSRRRYAYRFDGAVSSPSGEYAAIYEKRGIKGLILRRGEVLREINRSHYQADKYDYPIALFRLKNGREAIAHCPNAYCQLDIEDLETGEPLTPVQGRTSIDFFHTGLLASKDGAYLLSAGWAWHPIDIVRVFDIERMLLDRPYLDGKGQPIDAMSEDGASAAFLANGQLVVSLASYGNPGEDRGGLAPDRPEIRIFDPATGECLASVTTSCCVVGMMPVGNEYVLGFYPHPKLFCLTTGETVAEWPHLVCWGQRDLNNCSDPALQIAPDAMGWRCAISRGRGMTVMQFSSHFAASRERRRS